MCLRDKPCLFGPSPMRLKTFVAMTISSSLPNSRNKRPVISSLTPSEYMSAVSKKLMPASIAVLKNGGAASASRTHGRHFGSPYDMQPRQRRETVTPVWPRGANLMNVECGMQNYRKPTNDENIREAACQWQWSAPSLPRLRGLGGIVGHDRQQQHQETDKD